MYMSQSASNSPTPRSTSRVMMTGLIGPDLRREDCWSGPSHDDWRKTCLMESWRKTWHIPRTVERARLLHLWRAAHDSVEGLLSRTGGQARPEDRQALPDGGPFPCPLSHPPAAL